MTLLKELTEEYLGSLRYVNEIPREIELPISPDIVTIVGPRRSGKTFIMLKNAEKLLKMGENVLYVPFDEPALRRIEARRFAEMVRQEYPDGKVFLFLDEIQDWWSWDSSLRWLHDVKDFQIYVSGSSSTLQSSEIPSRLRGRYISRLLLPLSYREIAKSISSIKENTFRNRGVLKRILNEYLVWGGFPEVWLYRSREKIVSLLETMFYRDIVERHSIRNTQIFSDLLNMTLSNYSNLTTWHSIRRALKGVRVELDTKTVISYVEYMRQAFLIFILRRYSHSEKLSTISPKKIYVVDPAIINLFERPMDLGRRIENIVYIELIRQGKNPYYYITSSGKELDFIIKEAKIQVLEACVEVDEEHLKKTIEAAEELKAGKIDIITWDQEGEETVRGRKVRITPLWKWLLSRFKQ
jgi:predicted AAA+ superfamily ATPase